MLLLLPIKLVACWVISAVIHEFSHIFIIHICGGEVRRVVIGAFGAVIETDVIDGKKGALCAIAGPVGGFFLLIFRKAFPILAICAVVQSMYNLIPIYPLDGGRVFSYFLTKINNPFIVKWLQNVVTWMSISFLFVAGIRALISGLGPLPFVFAFLFFLRNRKFPCKERQQIVQ